MGQNAVSQNVISQLKKEVNDELFLGMQINIEAFYRLMLSFWMCVTRHAQSAQNKKFAYFCNISRKAWRMDLMGMVRHSQSSQNSKFAMCLQYLKKEVRDEVDFLHVD